MKKLLWSKVIAVIALVALSVAAVQCGYIMYPERRGQESGEIDMEVFILDCLWFLGGVIPGIIALAVDYSSGAIYKPGTSMNLDADKAMFALRLKEEAPQDAHVSVMLNDISLYEKDLAKAKAWIVT